jgi:hypothetical protein
MKIRALVLLLTFTTKVLAEEPVIEAIPPGDDKIVVVREGDKAPFTGQLFDGPTALRWANWLQQYRHILRLTIERDQKVCQVKLDYDAEVLAIEKRRAAATEQDLRERLVKSETGRADAEYRVEHPPFYRTVWFGVGIGVVGTVAVTYVAAQALASGK